MLIINHTIYEPQYFTTYVNPKPDHLGYKYHYRTMNIINHRQTLQDTI